MPVTLLPHQERGLARLLASPGTMLAWEPGCGKTFPALLAGMRQPTRQLYVCPSSIRWQVASEAKRLDPAINVQVVLHGTDRIEPTADLVVVSYDLAMSPVLWRELFARSWGSLVLDEAHYLKNADAKRTRAIYGARHNSRGALIRKAAAVWPLTGTPILNDPSDLWTHYSRLFPYAVTGEDGQPLRKRQWIDRYCAMRFTQFGEHIIGAKNEDELKTVLAPYVDRLRLADVATDLPPLTVDMVPLEGASIAWDTLAPELAEAVQSALRDDADDRELEALAPALATLRRMVGTAKIKATADLVTNELAGGLDKAIVFAIHTESVKGLADNLRRFGVGVIDGSVTPAIRQRVLQDFAEGKTRVLVAQLTAAGVGLNLQHCHRVVFHEAAWTPAVNAQGIGRCYRQGQTNPVHVSFMSLRKSIDEQVQGALARKARLIAKIID